MKKEDQNDDSLLFTEREIEGYKIKKMSFGELNGVTPELITMFDNITPLIDRLSGQTPSPAEVAGVYLEILPHALPVVAKLCNVTEEELRQLPAQTPIQLMRGLWELNREVIQDFFTITGMQGRSPLL